MSPIFTKRKFSQKYDDYQLEANEIIYGISKANFTRTQDNHYLFTALIYEGLRYFSLLHLLKWKIILTIYFPCEYNKKSTEYHGQRQATFQAISTRRICFNLQSILLYDPMGLDTKGEPNAYGCCV
jgi:hypothetical protein